MEFLLQECDYTHQNKILWSMSVQKIVLATKKGAEVTVHFNLLKKILWD